jgi:hypothetical protein
VRIQVVGDGGYLLQNRQGQFSGVVLFCSRLAAVSNEEAANIEGKGPCHFRTTKSERHFKANKKRQDKIRKIMD